MREKLSAFLDGELGHSESLSLINQLENDREMRGHWKRYHVYGSVLRDEMTPVLSNDFSERVLRALVEEPVQLAPAAMKVRKRWMGPLTGLALAASLAGIAVLLLKPVIQDTKGTGVSSVAELSAPVLPLPQSQGTTADYTSSDNRLIVSNSKNENIRDRINQLLVEHNEYNPASDMTGMLPYSRFVGYNPRNERSE